MWWGEMFLYWYVTKWLDTSDPDVTIVRMYPKLIIALCGSGAAWVVCVCVFIVVFVYFEGIHHLQSAETLYNGMYLWP